MRVVVPLKGLGGGTRTGRWDALVADRVGESDERQRHLARDEPGHHGRDRADLFLGDPLGEPLADVGLQGGEGHGLVEVVLHPARDDLGGAFGGDLRHLGVGHRVVSQVVEDLPHCAAIGETVVDLEEVGVLAVGESLDEVEAPHGTGAVQVDAHDPLEIRQEHLLVAGLLELHVDDVVVDVNRGLDPERVHGEGCESPAQGGQGREAIGDPLAQPGEPGTRLSFRAALAVVVEDRDAADVAIGRHRVVAQEHLVQAGHVLHRRLLSELVSTPGMPGRTAYGGASVSLLTRSI